MQVDLLGPSRYAGSQAKCWIHSQQRARARLSKRRHSICFPPGPTAPPRSGPRSSSLTSSEPLRKALNFENGDTYYGLFMLFFKGAAPSRFINLAVGRGPHSRFDSPVSARPTLLRFSEACVRFPRANVNHPSTSPPQFMLVTVPPTQPRVSGTQNPPMQTSYGVLASPSSHAV
jgi:hypothetical protein